MRIQKTLGDGVGRALACGGGGGDECEHGVERGRQEREVGSTHGAFAEGGWDGGGAGKVGGREGE